MQNDSRKAPLTLNAITLFLALFILGHLSACAPSLPLYLQVWDADLPAPAGTRATILIQPFDASAMDSKPIGELYGWQSSQQIRVDPQALAHGLTTKFERQLAEQKLNTDRGNSWDGTLAGMKKVAPGYRAIIGGTIRLLKIDSEKQGLYTVSRLRLVVDCRIGLPGDHDTLITRQVEISQERTHMLQQAAILEDLLNQGLEEAAVRLSAELKKVISSADPR